MSQIANFCMQCGTALVMRPADSGAIRPTCPNCGRIVYFDPKVAVVVFIEQGDQVLLIQRGIEPSKGLWALPAGFVEQEEPPEDAAIRETLEETGLAVTITRLLDVFPKRDNGAANIVIAYAAQISGGTLGAGDDAEKVGWFARDAIPELAFYPSKTLIARWQRGEL